MSKEVLREVLMTKEASMGFLRRNLLKSLGVGSGIAPRALGAAAGTSLAIPVLEAAGLAQTNPLFWGLAGASGVAGHDIAGMLGSKGYKKFLQGVSK